MTFKFLINITIRIWNNCSSSPYIFPLSLARFATTWNYQCVVAGTVSTLGFRTYQCNFQNFFSNFLYSSSWLNFHSIHNIHWLQASPDSGFLPRHRDLMSLLPAQLGLLLQNIWDRRKFVHEQILTITKPLHVRNICKRGWSLFEVYNMTYRPLDLRVWGKLKMASSPRLLSLWIKHF